jgi:hypothetical protein
LGDTESGPISDVWLYDLDSEIVIIIQCKLVDTKGKAPPIAYYRSVCDYIHDGKGYLALYVGKGKLGFIKNFHPWDLYRTDLETYTCYKLTDYESGAEVAGEKIYYYNGSFYLHSQDFLYIHNPYAKLSTQTTTKGIKYTLLIDFPQCIYNDSLYLIIWWDDIIEGTSFSIYKIDLSDENYSFKKIPISNKGVA